MTTQSPARAQRSASRIAPCLSGILTYRSCSAQAPRIPPTISSMIASGRSLRGLSEVTQTRSARRAAISPRSEEHTSELQSRLHLVCRLLLEKKKKQQPCVRHRSLYVYL